MSPVAGEIAREALALSDLPPAVTVKVMTQLPATCAVRLVESAAALAKVAQPDGEAVQANVIGSASPSIAEADTPVTSPTCADAGTTSDVTTGEWSGVGAGPVWSSSVSRTWTVCPLAT